MRSEGQVTEADLLIRPATTDDVDALADLYLAARKAAYPSMPGQIHSPDEVRRYIGADLDKPEHETWLAEHDDTLVAMMVLQGEWLHSLYVAPGHTGQGIGTVLLDLARSRRPRRLGLWVFQSNEGAQRFYRSHGFVEVRRTDGTGPGGNEEQQPDIEMAWPDPGSLAGLRGRIDEVDDRIAVLLAERAELTERVQRVKEVPGHAGRDTERERQIAARMARSAPRLGADRLQRIMHAVITESLDAAEAREPADGPA
jgi:chorismate mutase/ribosomal protein S18 acetylase RimI-like enzyme